MFRKELKIKDKEIVVSAYKRLPVKGYYNFDIQIRPDSFSITTTHYYFTAYRYYTNGGTK